MTTTDDSLKKGITDDQRTGPAEREITQWRADGLVSRNAIDMLTTTASQSIVLTFNQTEQGTVLAIA